MTSANYQSGSTYLMRRVRAKSQSGQSLLIALAILFLLGFLGALFSAIVIKNLSNAQSANETINTDYFAQAGINYANTMLETSPQGADWRPPLEFVPVGYTGSVTLPTANANDPDIKWLDAGYTRYNLNGGRFLLKVTYNPSITGAAALGNATAKDIRIDSVGRMGTINDQDPTTYTGTPPDYRRTELVAFKPIGIVDYSRFITNKDNRSDTANLGVPSVLAGTYPNGTVVTPGVEDISPTNLPAPSSAPYLPTEYPLVTYYGSANAYTTVTGNAGTNVPGGGTLRSNMNVRLYGENQVYLNPQYGDDWEVAGNLVFDQYDAMYANNNTSTPTNYNQLPAQLFVTTPGATAGSATVNDLFPSNDPNFYTDSGVIRDGNTGNDTMGYPRQIKRLNPPIIDTVDPVTGLTRYQELVTGLTNNNGVAMPAAGEIQKQQYSTSEDYVPATININNDSDIQTESINVLGGHTLRNDWLNHQSDTGGSWNGSFYSPPGTLITFGPVAAFGGGAASDYGITMTRSDVDSNGAAVQWTSPTSTTASSQIGQTLYLSYQGLPVPTQNNPSASALGYLDVQQAAPVPNDVVIYASGNVRIRGVISDPNGKPVHITIVTNGIAYIDGSIMKGNPDSTIAILARQYVCLNTTQLLAGAPTAGASVSNVSGAIGPPPALTFTSAETLTEESLFGPQYVLPANATSGGGTYDYALYVTQSAGATSESSLGQVSLGTGPADALYPIGNSNAGLTGTTPVRNVYTLGATPVADISAPISGIPFDLTFSKNASYTGDWLLQKAAVLPGDIVIQAVLYAQNNSFFVIPGDWFNTDPIDTLSTANNRSDVSTLDDRYPFYGQPIDLQISVDGAVSENVPADISDEAAWMQKWGWIPRYHGNVTTDISPHAYIPANGTLTEGIGLNFTYDPFTGFPYDPNTSYLREDRFGRPLPFAPALPVSPDLLYSGQTSD